MQDESPIIDRAMIRTLAEAARIDLAQEELPRLAAQLTDILGQIAVLTGVTMDGASSSDDADALPLDHAPAQPLRADEPGADMLHGTLGRFAPEIREGFFTVPVLPTHRGGAA